MKTFWALYVANAREFLRDKLALVISVIMPLIFAGFFGLIFSSGNQAFRLNMGVVSLDKGPGGAAVMAMLRSPETAKIINITEGDLDTLTEALRQGKQHIVVVLPEDFSQRLAAKEKVDLPVYYDPSSETSAATGLTVMGNLISQANLTMAGVPVLLGMAPQSVQTQRLSAFDFYVPNMLGMSLFWLGIFGTAQTLVEMRERQVLRRLSTTPISRKMVLASQVAWRVTVGMGQSAMFLLLGWLAFDLHFPAGIVLLPLVVLMGALVFVTLGYFIAAVSPTTDSSVAVAQFFNFAMMFFSGIFFQADFLPAFLRPVLRVMPLTYLADALRQTMSGYPAAYPLPLDLAVLAGFLVLLGGLTVRFWRWE